MGIALMVLTAIAGIAGSIAVGLVKDEVTAWLPSLRDLILRSAVMRIPPDLRERYKEEWGAHVWEYPGKLSQIYQALRCLRGGMAMETFDLNFAHRRLWAVQGIMLFGSFVLPYIDTYPQNIWWVDHVISFINFAWGMSVLWGAYWTIRLKATLLPR